MLKVESSGDLKGRESIAEKGSHLCLVESRLFFKHHRGTGDFAESSVGNAVNRHFAHARVFGDRVFNLGAANVLAASNNDVFRSV